MKYIYIYIYLFNINISALQKQQQVTPDKKRTTDADAEESSTRWKTQRITSDVTPKTKQHIIDKRAERKRETSREWHSRFEKAGKASCMRYD